MSGDSARLRSGPSGQAERSPADDTASASGSVRHGESGLGTIPGAEPLVQSLLEAKRPVSPNLIQALARVVRAGEQPVRGAFLARALNALARLAPRLDEEALGVAAGADSDYAVLLWALEEPDALAALRASDPLADARLRGLEVRERIAQAEGGTLTVEQAARLLGISRQAVDKRRRAGRMLALPIGNHRYAYPAWQFGQGGVLAGLRETLDELDAGDPWTRAAFFLGENAYLDGARPLDRLREGDIEPVRRAAWWYGKQGAP